MTILTHEPTKNVTRLLNEVLSSVRYLVDAKGGKTDVVLSLSIWGNLLALLEDLDDRAVVREWLPRLHAGPLASGALPWDNVAVEWEEDATV